ncbi:MAG TPA: 5-formyltetrahydrofolate cyclo-ligase, partial [Streptomyces sp.]|nr:5-formyltetrahydrofolate cyclo-ligase [Streptomyces sp.]
MSHGGRGTEPDKRTLRREFLAARSRLTADDVRDAAAALAGRALALPELAGAGTVAAYVSVGSEPGTLALLDALRARGARVLLPVLLPDDDLDWGEYATRDALARVRREGRMTLREPAGPRLGPDAVTGADAVLLPGLAVDTRGMRLGRGGGSYDRVLARLAHARADPALVLLLYDAEVVERV